jgi:flagellar motor protein MotB
LVDLQKGKPPTPGPLKDIYFSFDRYDLEGEARETLKVNADWLKRNPAVRIEIEGHADERGTNEYNLALGAKRAQAAKDYLITWDLYRAAIDHQLRRRDSGVQEQNEKLLASNRRTFCDYQARPAS